MSPPMKPEQRAQLKEQFLEERLQCGSNREACRRTGIKDTTVSGWQTGIEFSRKLEEIEARVGKWHGSASAKTQKPTDWPAPEIRCELKHSWIACNRCLQYQKEFDCKCDRMAVTPIPTTEPAEEHPCEKCGEVARLETGLCPDCYKAKWRKKRKESAMKTKKKQVVDTCSIQEVFGTLTSGPAQKEPDQAGLPDCRELPQDYLLDVVAMVKRQSSEPYEPAYQGPLPSPLDLTHRQSREIFEHAFQMAAEIMRA